MSIQQNINQTLSLASFIASQTPMAAAHREEVADKKARELASKEADKAVGTAEIATQNLTERERVSQGALLADQEVEAFQTTHKKPPSGEELDAYSKTSMEVWRKAYDKNIEAFSATQDPKFLERGFEYIGKIENEERKMKAREKDRAKRANASRDAKKELEETRLEPKGLSTEAVKSRLWKREDKK